VTGTATLVVAADDGPLRGAARGRSSLVDSLVARLHAEFGVDRDEVRRLAVEALAGFATAPVQAFVPILVEKRLRESCRAVRDGAPGGRVTGLPAR
jgi:hypothetical protein